MYIRKTGRPRTITLPDGTILSRGDLPAPTTVRWVARRKAAVVRAVRFGLIGREEAIDLYGLSEEEFQSWEYAVEMHGESALKATAVQRYRQP